MLLRPDFCRMFRVVAILAQDPAPHHPQEEKTVTNFVGNLTVTWRKLVGNAAQNLRHSQNWSWPCKLFLFLDSRF